MFLDFYDQCFRTFTSCGTYNNLFQGIVNILRNERTFTGYVETYKVEINNDRNLSDLLSVIKNSIKNLFDELLRKKGVLNIL